MRSTARAASTRSRCRRAIAGLALALGAAATPAGAEARPPNVLVVVFDDLRATDGDEAVETPHLDRLATRATAFTRAYAQQTSCNPSRTSMLTGLRPSTTGIVDNRVHYRTRAPEVVTLPQLFLANGYFTASIGKVFHKGKLWRDRHTWRYQAWPAGKRIGRLGRGRRVTGGRFSDDRWLAARGTDVDQPDGAAALEAVEMLGRAHDRPFFIAVGFLKPHPAFRAPRRDFRRYKLERLPSVWDGLPGPEVPAQVIPNPDTARLLETLSVRDRRELMRGYFACATFVDRQLGLLLDALDRLGLWDSTIVVALSDHGYHLGEHGWWGKNTLYEEALRVPLLVHAPGSGAPGRVSDRPVQLLDLYPTLAELAGLEAPDGLEGRSLRPLLRKPDRPWFPAFSEERRGSAAARSVRDDRWRYTEWGPGEDEVELYDLDSDPDQKINLAGDPAHAGTRARLARLLDGG